MRLKSFPMSLAVLMSDIYTKTQQKPQNFFKLDPKLIDKEDYRAQVIQLANAISHQRKGVRDAEIKLQMERDRLVVLEAGLDNLLHRPPE